ncbi:hypothetical protein AcV5_007382 [Taiwanofungus camphoratus]|nr:hypothetical protein AcV5_007382 [Antrodia cinnamomea]
MTHKSVLANALANPGLLLSLVHSTVTAPSSLPPAFSPFSLPDHVLQLGLVVVVVVDALKPRADVQYVVWSHLFPIPNSFLTLTLSHPYSHPFLNPVSFPTSHILHSLVHPVPPSTPTPSSPPPSDTSSSTPVPSSSSPSQSAPPSSPSPSGPGSSSSASSAGSSSSGSSGSSISTSGSSSSFSTLTHTSTVIGTNAQGSAFTSTLVQTMTVAPSVTASSHTSSSHTGAIVGGVVGGVAGLAVIVVLLFFLCRRRRSNDFDGNFDPDRVVGLSNGRDGATLPHIDLAGGEEVTPYNYNPNVPPSQGPGSAGSGGDEMRQHTNVPAFLAGGLAGAGAGAAAAGRGPGSSSPPVTSAPSNYSQSQSQYVPSSSDNYPDYVYGNYAEQQGLGAAGPGAGGLGLPPDFRQPSPGPSLSMTNSTAHTQSGNGAGVLPSLKEREAMGRRLQIANQGDPSNVMQHQDGGRLNSTPEEEDGPPEVPPRYDQIPRD